MEGEAQKETLYSANRVRNHTITAGRAMLAAIEIQKELA